MKSEKLEYKHFERLAPLLRKKNSFLSEYSFTNLYLFRKAHDYEVCYNEDCTFVRGITYDGFRYIMPVCPIEIISLDNILCMAKHTDCFFPIEEGWLKYFPEEYFTYKYLDSDSDYMYTTEKLAFLAGRKLSKKRNLLKQYNELYEVQDSELTEDRIGDAKEILDTWRSETEDNDYFECLEALKLKKELGLKGTISYADGKPAGFVLGEELNDETFVLHFAKATRVYKGVYQHTYNYFANTILNKYKYINFEQDLGKDSLKQAKSTYYPDDMKKKYRVFPK